MTLSVGRYPCHQNWTILWSSYWPWPLGRWIAGCLGDLGAWLGEVVYGAQAAESLVVGGPYQQRDPLRKAIQWSVTLSEAVHWWVRGHVQAPDDDEDYERPRQENAWANGYAEVAAPKSARGHRVALPLSLGAAYGSRRAGGPGKMEWRRGPGAPQDRWTLGSRSS